MAAVILSKRVATITELKRNPMRTIDAAEGEVVAIMNRNEPAFYCVPVKEYEDLLKLAERARKDANRLID
ncbi:plasmid stabilization protein (plasmid) [Candidatus Symbiopectobacterium sp. 'North America']|uniref:type II toxin-antitoxin system Phd/YefM family antitoxin n=1 Tax=Candidatus Symbiopectobacterium sp. 'North America' TaxID=2794574 RepID=UPI0018C8FC7C|nr:type II toxin-antitoxin system prevent-host-death family antitoxin [Candidatus Symbiopectobacterium sp. 'North America']MBG6246636.1 plasmid stabilization protein [Candidatus Symbiopectobacterium sp. 'North America']